MRRDKGSSVTLVKWIIGIATVILGVIGVCAFGYYALVDWAALQTAYVHYEQVAHSSGDVRALFAAYAEQEIHRTNLFADGVWTLLSAILAAVGRVSVYPEAVRRNLLGPHSPRLWPSSVIRPSAQSS